MQSTFVLSTTCLLLSLWSDHSLSSHVYIVHYFATESLCLCLRKNAPFLLDRPSDNNMYIANDGRIQGEELAKTACTTNYIT